MTKQELNRDLKKLYVRDLFISGNWISDNGHVFRNS